MMTQHCLQLKIPALMKKKKTIIQQQNYTICQSWPALQDMFSYNRKFIYQAILDNLLLFYSVNLLFSHFLTYYSAIS